MSEYKMIMSKNTDIVFRCPPHMPSHVNFMLRIFRISLIFYLNIITISLKFVTVSKYKRLMSKKLIEI